MGPKKSALCEWATTGLYHVFRNYCHSSSGHVRFVDTFCDESNRSFGGNFMIYGARAFDMNIKNMKKNEMKKRGAIPNVVRLQTQRFAQLQVSLKNICKIFPCSFWGGGEAFLFISTLKA